MEIFIPLDEPGSLWMIREKDSPSVLAAPMGKKRTILAKKEKTMQKQYTSKEAGFQNACEIFWCANELKQVSGCRVSSKRYAVTFLDRFGNTQTAANKHMCPDCNRPLGVGAQNTVVLAIVPQ